MDAQKKPKRHYDEGATSNPFKNRRWSPVDTVPKMGASVNDFMDKNYCLVRCMYMYFSFDGAFRMISNLFSGWPWTIMLFLCNNYVTVHVGKTVRGLWNVSSRVHEN